MRLTIGEIAEATRGVLLAPGEGAADNSNTEASRVVATGITWDSRQVKPGDVYVALPGERVDGHDFADAAIEAGAVALLVSREAAYAVPAVVVEDTARAFVDLATYWRQRIDGIVVGLTGSTGKTTTKNLVRDVLSSRNAVVATKANQNNELGVPNTLLAAEVDTDFVVVEMGMRGTGQIAELCTFAQPDWGLVTNVGESHIELLGSRLAIAHAKAELPCALPDSCGIAFVNAADEYAGELVEHAHLADRGVTCVYFDGGVNPKFADDLSAIAGHPYVWASDISLDEAGCPTFTLHAVNFDVLKRPEIDGEHACTLALRGLHNVSNACSAAAVGLASGMTLDQCCAALAASQPERGRQQVWRTDEGVVVVDDSYNANPDSMRASLTTFSALDVDGRRIAVLGDMLELGDFATECHERVGKLAAASSVDVLVCVGELSRSIAQGAIDAGMDERAITLVPDAACALETVKSLVKPGDAVLVKASHSIGLERVVEGLVG